MLPSMCVCVCVCVEFYECSVDVGPFWTDNPVITRKLPPLKYYHDLTISNTYQLYPSGCNARPY